MNKHQVKGLANQATGEIKQQVGKLTGDRSLQARGAAREMQGQAQEKLGNAKESIKSSKREVMDRELDERAIRERSRSR